MSLPESHDPFPAWRTLLASVPRAPAPAPPDPHSLDTTASEPEPPVSAPVVPGRPLPDDALLLLGPLEISDDPAALDALRLALLGLSETGDLKACLPGSRGSLALALGELCLGATPPIGALLDLSSLDPEPALDALLFQTSAARALVTCAHNHATKLLERARLLEVSAIRLGTLGGERLVLRTRSSEFSTPVTELLLPLPPPPVPTPTPAPAPDPA